MSFPTPYTVDVLHLQPAGQDDYGNDTETFGPAHTQRVYGWAPGGAGSARSTREADDARATVVTDLQLFAPAEFVCGAQDRVVIGGVTYFVEGNVEDFNHGPFGFRPGVRVNLQRVTG